MVQKRHSRLSHLRLTSEHAFCLCCKSFHSWPENTKIQGWNSRFFDNCYQFEKESKVLEWGGQWERLFLLPSAKWPKSLFPIAWPWTMLFCPLALLFFQYLWWQSTKKLKKYLHSYWEIVMWILIITKVFCDAHKSHNLKRSSVPYERRCKPSDVNESPFMYPLCAVTSKQ